MANINENAKYAQEKPQTQMQRNIDGKLMVERTKKAVRGAVLRTATRLVSPSVRLKCPSKCHCPDGKDDSPNEILEKIA